mgnify:CR=1 FL=1
MGKYGGPVQQLLQKASQLEIKQICPLHGPVLKENLAHAKTLIHQIMTATDFRQPEAVYRLDNIAGACAACGLIELNRLTGKGAYLEAAGRLLDGLIEGCCDLSPQRCGLLTHCTASYHDDAAGVHTNIVYGDYFLVEALAKLAGTDPGLWRR